MFKHSFFFLFIILFPSFLSAGGYQVNLHGSRNLGMGLLGTGLNRDGSSVFYNPGALASIPAEKFSFLAGTSLISSTTAFRLSYSSEYVTDNQISTPVSIYATWKLTNRLVAGFAINNPYGNNLNWEERWAGRFLVTDVSLRTFTYQPTLSYQINDDISVGAGLIIATGSFDLNRNIPLESTQGEGSININGQTANYGFNVGVLYQPASFIKMGLSYRSQINMKIDDATTHISVPASVNSLFNDNQTVETSLPLPANLDMGITYERAGIFEAGIGLNFVFWEAYQVLNFDFSNNSQALPDSENPKEYSNSLIIRAGAEYFLQDNFVIRAGGYYDPSPVNSQYFSPETPSLNSIAGTAGLGFILYDHISIDAAFAYIHGLETEASYEPANFKGTYKSNAFIPSISINYSF